jgi:hypothetical protein
LNQILVAEIVVVLEKCTVMYHRENSLSKVSPLGLINILDYFPVMGINRRKASLPKKIQLPNLGRSQRVQDVYQEMLDVFLN